MLTFPEEIQKIINGQCYTKNEIGKSDSDVYMFPEHVLKIQKETPETVNEYAVIQWLNGRIPVPEMPVYCVEDGIAYTLMTRVQGKMLCAKEYLTHPEQLIRLTAEGLKQLWSVDITECPVQGSRLEERLKYARWKIEHGLVDLENAEPDTFGENGFSGPEELLNWLEVNKPEEDLVFSHGDYCLPNVFIHDDQLSGFIDLGKTGPADRWKDISTAIWSLQNNVNGKYSGGKKYFDFHPQMLLDELGIEMDEKKYRYYLLLDEL